MTKKSMMYKCIQVNKGFYNLYGAYLVICVVMLMYTNKKRVGAILIYINDDGDSDEGYFWSSSLSLFFLRHPSVHW